LELDIEVDRATPDVEPEATSAMLPFLPFVADVESVHALMMGLTFAFSLSSVDVVSDKTEFLFLSPATASSLATTLGCEGAPLSETSSLSGLALSFPASLKIPPLTSSFDVSKNAKSSKLGATKTSAIYIHQHHPPPSFTYRLLQELLELIQDKRALDLPFRSHETDFDIHDWLRGESVPYPITWCWLDCENHVALHRLDHDCRDNWYLNRLETDGYGGEKSHCQADLGVWLVLPGDVFQVRFKGD
jgi:hypothetical protein